MKGFFVLAIAGIFALVMAVSIVYGWGATASCWKTGESGNGTNYANAMAGSHGLHNGFVRAETTVGLDHQEEDSGFGNQFVVVSAHSSGDFDAPGEALSVVHGYDEDEVFQVQDAEDDN